MDAFGGNGTNGTVAPALDPFAALVAPGVPVGTSAQTSLLEQVARNVSSGQPLARVLATGFADGSALARLAAAYAAGAWPQAQVRCISFGAQRIGDHWFTWAAQQLMDIEYQWAVQGDPRILDPPASPEPPMLLYLNDNATRLAPGLQEFSLQHYVKNVFKGPGELLSLANADAFKGDAVNTGALHSFNMMNEDPAACPALL
ncbi:hypothetical protein WJX81_002604 [Elliptochloris bilobata]|uniref:Fungal lipase-type domain-containing protein n=1 Tax=Elliptochloris bilobata TaxID=381761 RepID=A0AAW1QCP5_9CHLO